MVGATGIEPVTPTMSTSRHSPERAEFHGLSRIDAVERRRTPEEHRGIFRQVSAKSVLCKFPHPPDPGGGNGNAVARVSAHCAAAANSQKQFCDTAFRRDVSTLNRAAPQWEVTRV